MRLIEMFACMLRSSFIFVNEGFTEQKLDRKQTAVPGDAEQHYVQHSIECLRFAGLHYLVLRSLKQTGSQVYFARVPL